MQYGKAELCGLDTSRLKVPSVIHRFRDRGEELDDLFQVGVIGLMKAINREKEKLTREYPDAVVSRKNNDYVIRKYPIIGDIARIFPVMKRR